MIIKKSQFKYNKKLRGNWPFAVDEVAVVGVVLDKVLHFAIVHEYKLYALSGELKTKGYPALPEAGIWAPECNGCGFKKLGPFFDFIKKQVFDLYPAKK